MMRDHWVQDVREGRRRIASVTEHDSRVRVAFEDGDEIEVTADEARDLVASDSKSAFEDLLDALG